MNDEARDQVQALQTAVARARLETNVGIAALCALLVAAFLTIRQQSSGLLRAANELADSEERYRLLFEHSSDLVRLHADNGRTVFVSPSVLRLLGHTPVEFMAMAPPEFLHPDEVEPVVENVDQVLNGACSKSVLTYRLRHKNGEFRWFEVHVQRVRNADGSLVVQSSARDITKRLELEQRLAQQAEELRDLSLQDGLTGLYNRRGFMEVSKPMLKAALREKRAAALLFVDLDGLKLVNDRLGHEAGDRFIREAATVLQSTCRASDVVARLGGDEFVVLAPHAGAGPESVKMRIERAVADLNAEPGREYELSFSVGAAMFDPLSPAPLDELLKLADSRMYDAKVARRRQRSTQSGVSDPRELAGTSTDSQPSNVLGARASSSEAIALPGE